uniref:putative disease resistance protein At3g14460 n=1 Tax=Erigeron canadensis TaxID=72917 RepID=UPI001CB9BBC8|nr:putative disease resistance protein At3g14460 [Erigeron canadensis]
MPDLINDLATSVAGENFFMLGQKNAVNCRNGALEKLHHFSYIFQECEVYRKFKALYTARRLRTFLPVSVKRDKWERFYLSSKILTKLLPQQQFLRVLSLAKYRINEVPQSIEGLKHLRYLNFSDTDITCLPEQIGDLYNLQSLLLSGCTKLSRLPDSLVKLKNLRYLNLSGCTKLSRLPDNLIKLINLRYLNFSRTDITCVPEKVGNLYNLQSLLLSGCHGLCSLPSSLVKLINLRHLEITDTPKLKELPIGIGELTGLQTLSKVIIGDANRFKISHLKDLQHLQGRLTIEGLHKVAKSTDAKEANLQQKKGLHDLKMEWSDVFDDSRNELIESEVLEGLRPFEKLTNIKISKYMGI